MISGGYRASFIPHNSTMQIERRRLYLDAKSVFFLFRAVSGRFRQAKGTGRHLSPITVQCKLKEDNDILTQKVYWRGQSHVSIGFFFGKIPLSADGIWGPPAERIVIESYRSRPSRNSATFGEVFRRSPIPFRPHFTRISRITSAGKQLPQNNTKQE